MKKLSIKSILPSILAISCLLGQPTFAREQSEAGPGTGGGGGVVLCLNPDQTIRSAELIDLVESAFYDRTEFSESFANLPWELQVELAMSRIAFVDPGFHTQVSIRLKKIKSNLNNAFLNTKDTEIVFPAPQDLSHGRVPPIRIGCQLSAAAVYNDANPEPLQLTISHYIWKHLSPMHKAGLILHEAIYLTQRNTYRNLQKSRSETPDSSSTRALVGFLFSKELELNSRTESEKNRFAASKFYRGVDLPFGTHDPRESFRKRLQFVMKPHLISFLKDLERPLYMESKTCLAPTGFSVKVVHQKLKAGEKAKCQLVLIGHLWPAKVDRKTIPITKWDAKSNTAFHSLTLGEPKVFEDLVLACPSQGLDADNPGFQLYCGQELIAQVKGSKYSFTTTGLSLRLKKDSDFSQPFKFE